MRINDTGLRHAVSMIGILIGALIFFAGYVAGQHGWWWIAFGLLVIYGIVYKVIDAGH
ncbi:MAG: hypothetical protein Q7K39_04000 [Candidatus Magasanikbacteria bacterium]|nr:hypothetical protein [Candidatus Magasanikbacteria bacterium]